MSAFDAAYRATVPWAAPDQATYQDRAVFTSHSDWRQRADAAGILTPEPEVASELQVEAA